MNKSSNDPVASLLVIIALVGIVGAAFWLLKQLFHSADSSPDLQLAVWQKNRQIEELTRENKQLAEENAYLRKLLHWWSLVKGFLVRLAERLLFALLEKLFWFVCRFAAA